MGIRRDSDGAYCPRSFCQRTDVLSACFLGLLLITGTCACDLKKEQKPAEPPAQQVQKMPLPQREPLPPAGSAAKVPAEKKEAAPVAGQGEKTAQTAAANGARPAPKPAPPAGPPSVKPVPKPAPPARPAPKPAEVMKKVEAPANGKKALPLRNGSADRKQAPVAKVEPKDARQMKKSQPVAAEKKSVPAPATDKTKTAANKQQQKGKPALSAAVKKTHHGAEKASTRNWTVVTGPYLLEEDLATDLAKAGKAGLNATVQQGSRRKAAMHRLFLGQFDDRAAARAELERLNKLTSDGFIIDRGGKHAVYAGSYLLASRAQSEKERLAAAGIALTISRTDVAIPAKVLNAGTYRDRGAAEAAARKLRGAGIKSVQVRQ